MTVKQGASRSSFRRGLGLVGLSSSMLFGTAALAGGVSIVYASLQMPESLMADWLVRPLAAAGLVTVGSSATIPVTIGSTTSVVATPTPTPTPTAATGTTSMPATKIGVNIGKLTYWTKTRFFSNLTAGNGWTGSGGTLRADQRDANRNIIKLDAGQKAEIIINRPQNTYRGKATDVICRWTGEGTVLFPARDSVRSAIYSKNSARFTYLAEGSAYARFQISTTNPANPIKNVDCRETTADVNAVFDPTFVASLRKYNTIRFMDWQGINANVAVTWADRTKPDMAEVRGNDGPSIEHMIMLANQTKTNPWFNIPWNADADYVRKFAELVRDQLDPSLTAYIELSNEIWNIYFAVNKQAQREGEAKGFPKGSYAIDYRTAERHIEVMKVWTDVFKDNPKRLVRVLASQQGGPHRMKRILAYNDAYKYVDAISGAPYIADSFDTMVYNPNDLTSVFANLQTKLDAMKWYVEQYKAMAAQYKVRYVAYEAGQHYVGDDTTSNSKFQHDARMGTFYRNYLDFWRKNAGDLMVLYNDTEAGGSGGMWGMNDYAGQPMSEAPKANAVNLFIASINNK